MKKIWLIIIFGIILRLGLMPFTIHPDIRGHYLGGLLIAKESQFFGVYDYISRLPREHILAKLYGDNFLVYSPLTYWSHALFINILSPLYPPGLLEKLITHMDQAAKDPGLPWLLFLLKFPYLLLDLVILKLLWRILGSKHRQAATLLWAFNLPLIYSAYLMGQFDIFIVLFMLLAAWLAGINRPSLAAVALALSAGYKPFGLILVPFLPGNKIKNIFIAAVSYLAIIAIYLPSPGYRMYALLAQQSDKIWYAKIMVSGSQYLPVFLVGVVLLFWWSYIRPKALPVWGWLATPLLIFYSVVHYHPQWFAWISPFLIISWILKPQSRLLILTMFMAHLAVVFSFEPSLNFGLFGLPYSLNHWLNDTNMSLIRGILAGSSLALIPILSSTNK